MVVCQDSTRVGALLTRSIQGSFQTIPTSPDTLGVNHPNSYYLILIFFVAKVATNSSAFDLQVQNTNATISRSVILDEKEVLSSTCLMQASVCLHLLRPKPLILDDCFVSAPKVGSLTA